MKELLSPTELAAVRKEAEHSAPLIAQIKSLTIKDDSSLALASLLLSKVAAARRAIADRMDLILKPLNTALESARSLRRELDRGPAEAEEHIRSKMVDYRAEESRRIKEAEQARQREINEAKRLAEEAERKEQLAKTEPMRLRLAQKRLEAELKVEEKIAEPTPEPVRVMGSTSRTVKSVRIVDQETFIKAVAAGKIPKSALPWDDIDSRTKRLFRSDPMVAQWPGVEVFEEISIVRR